MVRGQLALNCTRQKAVPITLTFDDDGAVMGFEMKLEGFHIGFPSLTERPVIADL
jgi:hypothetical protein